MNPTHLHLIITHLPIFGSIIGALALAYGMYTKSRGAQLAGYYILLISAVGGGIAYLTGEPAEEVAENIQGVSHDIIEEHEEFGKFALISCISLGILAIIGIYAILRGKTFVRTINIIVLLVSLLTFGITGWSGYLGGQIRHTEVNEGQQ